MLYSPVHDVCVCCEHVVHVFCERCTCSLNEMLHVYITNITLYMYSLLCLPLSPSPSFFSSPFIFFLPLMHTHTHTFSLYYSRSMLSSINLVLLVCRPLESVPLLSLNSRPDLPRYLRATSTVFSLPPPPQVSVRVRNS